MNRIAILANDKRDLELMVNAIRSAGFDGELQVLKEAGEFMDRLQDAENNPPLALFVDFSAVPNGLQLVEGLKRSARTQRLRIVAIGSENDTATVFEDAWDCHTVLTKPLCAADVRQLVTALQVVATSDATPLRSQQIRNLVRAIERSKRLRAEYEQSPGHAELAA
jgi:PleD family two-component response regulator